MKHVKMTLVVNLEEGGSADDSKQGVMNTVAESLADGLSDRGLYWTTKLSNPEESWS